MVDIIEFCESPKYLNQTLWPWQKIILKSFYGLKLDHYELKKIFEDLPLDSDYKEYSILDNFMYKINNELKELVLIIGRRGGVTRLNQFIEYYELYKLLELDNPFEYFSIPEYDDITVYHTTGSECAVINDSILKNNGEEILNIPYFIDKIDMKAQKTKNEIKFKAKNGNGHVRFWWAWPHSYRKENPNVVAAILEETSRMFDGIYDFYQKIKEDAAKLNGRVICTSQASSRDSDIYKIYQDAMENSHALVIQIPTQVANPTIGDN